MKKRYILGVLITSLLTSQSVLAGHDAILDIYVAYSKEKRQAEGGTNSIRSKILTSQAVFNKANRDSNINLRVNLLGLDEVSYTRGEKTGSRVLNDLVTNRIGNLKAKRNQYGADKIAFISNLEGCGIAKRPGQHSVTRCLAQHTFAHEVGHNLGCGHGGGHGKGSSPFAQGFVGTGSDGKRYKTIMIGNYDLKASMTYRWSGYRTNYNNVINLGTSRDVANNQRQIRSKLNDTNRRKINPTARPSDKWILINRLSDLAVQVPDAKTENRVLITQDTLGGNHKRWKFRSVDRGYAHITNHGTGGALDKTRLIENGRQFWQWAARTSNRNQHFKIDHSARGYVRLRCRDGGKLVHNHGNTADRGAKVTQWDWVGSRNLEYELRWTP